MKKIKISFAGAFDLLEDYKNPAMSAAGNQVQVEIINALSDLNLGADDGLQVISLKQIRAWPYGPIIWRGIRSSNYFSPSFINLSFIRRVFFSCSLFCILVRKQSEIVVTYNPSLSDCLALIFYRVFFPSAFLVAIIQDVHYSSSSKLKIKGLADWFSMKIVRNFDFLVPISKKIKEDFGFESKKTTIFNGGLTRQGRDLRSENEFYLSPYAVFAGALETYNGIDRLIDKWISIDSNLVLHIFGKGSCESIVHAAASKCSRIIYHGFKSESETTDWQKRAMINFCLRYSHGIEAGYFFPSKLFNVVCAPGAVISNEFDSFPVGLKESCFMVLDDLSNLNKLIKDIQNSDFIKIQRRNRLVWVEQHANWGSIAEEIRFRSNMHINTV